MKIELVVFDLDGTLVSSHTTIYKATQHALADVGIYQEMPEDVFLKMIGMHFEDIFLKFGFKVPDFEHFIKIYKSIYFDYIGYSSLYRGTEAVISFLKKKNIKIGLLTTKAQDQAELILKYFDLYDKFDGIMGRRPGMQHKPSPEPLFKLCEEVNLSIHNTLMVGDSELDIECGKNAGSFTCAVTFGYRDKEFLAKSNPHFMIDNIREIEYILNNTK